jgi:hypothetical protein
MNANSPTTGVIKPNPGAFAANFRSNSRTLSLNKSTTYPTLTDKYNPNPYCPYFFIYAGLFLITPTTLVLAQPDIYVNVTFNFLSGGVPQSTLSTILYGGTVASNKVNFPLVNLNYDPLSPSLAYCNSAGCVGLGGNNPPTSWALGTRWTSVVDSIEVQTSVIDLSTQVVSPSNYALMNAVIEMPWG